MTRTPLRLASLLIWILLAAHATFAQVAPGVPPFSSTGGSSFDVIDLANLNVHLSIPIINKAGRGLPFNYVLTYDNSVWYPSTSSGSKTWTPISNWGWRGVSEATTGYISYATASSCKYLGGTVYSNWVYHDALGVQHPFGGFVLLDASHCGGSSDSGGNTATDDSGLYINASTTNLPATTVTSPFGVVYHPPLQSSTGSGTVTDPNGNQLTTTFDGNVTTTFTDTLATTALTVVAPAPPSSATYTYIGPSGGNVNVTEKFTALNIQTNFGCSGITEYSASNVPMVTEIDLPDGTTYTFTYEETTAGSTQYYTGRLAWVTLPTGGKISYGYGTVNHGINCADGTLTSLTRTTPDGMWTYTHSEAGSQWATNITDPQNNLTVMNFQGLYETQRTVNQGSSTVLETVNTCYNGASMPCNSTAITQPISNRTVQVTFPNFIPSKTYTTYNTYGLPLTTDEYFYGLNFAQETMTCYASLSDQYIRDRPSTTVIYTATGNPSDCSGTSGIAAKTTFSYDGNGNRLSEVHSTGGTLATLSRSFTYSSNGVLQTATDFNGKTTTYTNTSCNNAFPTTTTLPLSLSTSASWNCNVALPNSITDVNSNPRSLSYDSMVRPTEITFPDGGWNLISYTGETQQDAYTGITSATPSTSCTGCRHDQLDLDGLGRVTMSALVNDPDGETYVAASYDSVGRLASVSNPYRGSSSQGGDTYTYDALNRKTKVTHADSTYAQLSYGGSASQSCPASTYGYGYPTLYTDESGNQRQIFADALGRIIEVDEPNSGGSLTVNTCYTYDALNNLHQVIQGSETRTFVHDMLSRLTQATTPEGGTIHLCYTTSSSACATPDTGTTPCSGNPNAVCRRTDARSITTTYTYDALNRLTGKSYSNNNPTATSYTYDQTSCLGLSACYNKGQRTTMTDASGSTEWAYDAMGRILVEHRTIGSVTNNIAYTYNLDGSTATLTYPSGRTITYTVKAAQRPVSGVDTADSINYVLNATYAPQGGVAGALMGSSGSFGGITFQATYTNRLLPHTATATSSGGNALNLTLGYYANGNVETITNNLITGRTETVTYDNLNRVATAQGQATSGAGCWGQSFSYDRYGNLLSATPTKCQIPTGLSVSVNTSNQIIGLGYDASGDLTSDGTYTYAWDARNRLQSAGGVTYTYDGDGKRVMKSSGTLYWNSPDGTPLAETNSSGTTLNEYIFLGGARIARRDSSGNVYYYFQDQVGSTKTITTSAGVVCYDADSLPFGGEMAYATTCAQNYKFTGLERDSETGNDHTLFRMYDSSLGRWLSPDPLTGDVTNPQSFNRYAYVVNNPCSLTDLLGLDTCNFNIAINNQTGQNIDINGIEARMQQIFQVSSKGLPNSVGLNFSGAPDATLNLTNAGWASPQGTFGYQGGLFDLDPTVYWNRIQNAQPQSTSIAAGDVAVHELGHQLLPGGFLWFGAPDEPYNQNNPNLMMFDAAPQQAQTDALTNPLSPFWKFTQGQISALFQKCQGSHPPIAGAASPGLSLTLLIDVIEWESSAEMNWYLDYIYATVIPNSQIQRK